MEKKQCLQNWEIQAINSLEQADLLREYVKLSLLFFPYSKIPNMIKNVQGVFNNVISPEITPLMQRWTEISLQWSQVQANRPSARGQDVSQILHYSRWKQHGCLLQHSGSAIVDSSLLMLNQRVSSTLHSVDKWAQEISHLCASFCAQCSASDKTYLQLPSKWYEQSLFLWLNSSAADCPCEHVYE